MNIYMNGYSIDMTMDNEKTLDDIIKGISDWAAKRNLIFTRFELDGESHSTESFPDRPKADIGNLNCVIQSKSDLILSTISEGIAYCDKVVAYVAESEKAGDFDLSQRDFFCSGIQWLNDSLGSIFQLLSLSPEDIRYLDRSVADYLAGLNAVDGELKKVSTGKDALRVMLKARDIVDVIKGVYKMLMLSDSLKTIIVQSLESPDELIRALKDVKDALPVQTAAMEEASAAFQSGKDAEGAEKLQDFTDFIYRYVRVCHQISPVFGIDPSSIEHDGLSLEQLNGSLHQYLEDIISVMENNDIISLSDILEYELKPQLEKIGAFVDILLDKIRAL